MFASEIFERGFIIGQLIIYSFISFNASSLDKLDLESFESLCIIRMCEEI